MLPLRATVVKPPLSWYASVVVGNAVSGGCPTLDDVDSSGDWFTQLDICCG